MDIGDFVRGMVGAMGLAAWLALKMRAGAWTWGAR